jgi:hypothetical protein
VTAAAGAHDQPLVVYHAASVKPLVCSTPVNQDRAASPARECRHKSFVINLIGAIVVAFTHRAAPPALGIA